MFKTTLTIILGCALMLFPIWTTCQTGSPTWEALGPYGGTIEALAVDARQPNTLYAGANVGSGI